MTFLSFALIRIAAGEGQESFTLSVALSSYVIILQYHFGQNIHHNGLVVRKPNSLNNENGADFKIQTTDTFQSRKSA